MGVPPPSSDLVIWTGAPKLGGLSQGAPVCWTWCSSVGSHGQVEQAGEAEADQRVLPEAGAHLGHVPARHQRADQPGRQEQAPVVRVEHQREQHREERQVAAPAEREHVQERGRGHQRQHEHERVHARLLRVRGEERVDRAERGADQARRGGRTGSSRPTARPGRRAARSRPRGPASRPARCRSRPSRPRAACSRAAASRPRAARAGCRTAAATRSRSTAPRPSRATRRASACAGRTDTASRPSRTSAGSTKLDGSERTLGSGRMREETEANPAILVSHRDTHRRALRLLRVADHLERRVLGGDVAGGARGGRVGARLGTVGLARPAAR